MCFFNLYGLIQTCMSPYKLRKNIKTKKFKYFKIPLLATNWQPGGTPQLINGKSNIIFIKFHYIKH